MGLPRFAPRYDTDLLRPYWAALARGEIELAACAECGSWQWYPTEIPRCHPRAHIEWRKVATTGTVFVCTTVQRCLLPENKDAAPYVNALIELEGVKGPRIVGLLVDFPGEPRAGAKVRLVPVKVDDLFLPAFAPA